MKKKLYALCALLCTLTLLSTSCTVNWFDRQYDVPWWMIAIPATVFTVGMIAWATAYITSKTYVCPRCAHTFRPKWTAAIFSIHVNDDRLFKCPRCGKRSFCRPSRSRED